MEMVGGLDLHRSQITFDVVDGGTGEVWRGRVIGPDRERVRRWLREEVAVRAAGRPVRLAVEGCTGWRVVVEEIIAARFEAAGAGAGGPARPPGRGRPEGGGQDRPQRRPPAARAAGGGDLAQFVGAAPPGAG